MPVRVKEISRHLHGTDTNIFERLFWIIIVAIGCTWGAVMISQEAIDWINTPTRNTSTKFCL